MTEQITNTGRTKCAMNPQLDAAESPQCAGVITKSRATGSDYLLACTAELRTKEL